MGAKAKARKELEREKRLPEALRAPSAAHWDELTQDFIHEINEERADREYARVKRLAASKKGK